VRGSGDLGRFVQRVQRARGNVPLLVVRVGALGRIAWREGRPAARKIERQCWQRLAERGKRLVRAGDARGHASSSEDFLVALLSGAREAPRRASAVDCRAVLRRLATTLVPAGVLETVSGWAILPDQCNDATLRDAIERALRDGARERERYEFFSTIGHELRTPLSAVRGYVEALLDERPDPATTRHFLETVRAEALRMSRLVDGMFDISLLDLAGASLPRERSLLEPALSAAEAAVSALLRSRRVRLERSSYETIAVGLPADALTHVLINLLDNAAKHGRESGRVRVVAESLPSHVELVVDDDGPGIPPDERERVFGLGRRSTTARAAGTGLGLAFVRLLLERSGGSVEALEGPLGGARLRLCLPPPPG